MKREEKSTLGFMVLCGSPMPGFLIAEMVNTSQMIRLIIVLAPIVLGMYLMMRNMERETA